MATLITYYSKKASEKEELTGLINPLDGSFTSYILNLTFKNWVKRVRYTAPNNEIFMMRFQQVCIEVEWLGNIHNEWSTFLEAVYITFKKYGFERYAK